jgi:hypothetical protein
MPDAYRAVRGQLADQRSATPDRRRRERTSELPNLAAGWGSPVALTVAIPRRDLRDELRQGVAGATRSNHYRTAFHRDVNGIPFIDLRFERNRFGQTESQAVAPLRNLRTGPHVSTLNIHPGVGGVNRRSGWARREPAHRRRSPDGRRRADTLHGTPQAAVHSRQIHRSWIVPTRTVLSVSAGLSVS